MILLKTLAEYLASKINKSIREENRHQLKYLNFLKQSP
jgi:hypothetical protein